MALSNLDPLSKLAFKYGTDKCPQLNHCYTPFYYQLLKDKRRSIKKVLEMGIGNGKHTRKFFPHAVTGASLFMWRDFFPNAQIYGADNDPETIFESERIKTYLCDETKREDLLRLINETGTDIDLFIDDGSHSSNDQQFLCRILMPLFKKDVIYIIEDVRLLGTLGKKLAEYDCIIPKLPPKKQPERGRDQIMIVKHKQLNTLGIKSDEFRVQKTVLETKDYCGFKLRFRDDFADRYIMRDMLKRDYTRIPKDPKTVIDIGAHIGLFTLAAIRAGAKKIFAFEPEEFNYELLCHNMKINGYEDRVDCINLGVGTAGQSKLYIHPANSGASSIYLAADKRLESDKYQIINLISIRDVFKNYGIKYCDLLKIDCEGSDKDILNDLDEDLIGRIGQISVEIHDRSLIEAFVEKLKKWYEAECTNLGARGGGGNAWVFRKKI